jgi:hypothetical protein
MNQGKDDGLARELLAASESDPEEALHRISGLDSEWLAKPVILFSQFNALKNLAGRRLVAAGIKSISPEIAADIESYFGPYELNLARRALIALSQMEAVSPTYLARREFIYDIVDALVPIVEIVDPGAAQRILGWTKIGYFGPGCVRFYGKLMHEIPQDLQRKILQRRLRIDDIVTVAIMFGSGAETIRGRYVDVMLLSRNPEGTETVSDVVAGTLRYFENDEAEYTKGTMSDG